MLYDMPGLGLRERARYRHRLMPAESHGGTCDRADLRTGADVPVRFLSSSDSPLRGTKTKSKSAIAGASEAFGRRPREVQSTYALTSSERSSETSRDSTSDK